MRRTQPIKRTFRTAESSRNHTIIRQPSQCVHQSSLFIARLLRAAKSCERIAATRTATPTRTLDPIRFESPIAFLGSSRFLADEIHTSCAESDWRRTKRKQKRRPNVEASDAQMLSVYSILCTSYSISPPCSLQLEVERCTIVWAGEFRP